jgi:lipoprotein-releasing system permease protein
MIRPLPLYIGLRYTRAKRRNRFISFISLASTVGIALGVAVLLTVLSVMNGFDQQIRQRFFATAPQVTMGTEQEAIDQWPHWLQQVRQVSEVEAGAPFVSTEGILIKNNVLRGVQVMGILPAEEAKISPLTQHLIDGGWDGLTSGSFHIVITQNLAEQFGLRIGDSVNVFTSQATTTPLGLFPRYRRFQVVGIYQNNSNGITQEPVYIALDDAQKLFAAGRHMSGLHLKLKDMYQAPRVKRQIQSLLPADFTVTDWTVESGAFFQALAMEKVMMFIILLLIIAIAAFNLVSMLMMMVNEKRADIAILRTLGAPPHMIGAIFMVQGALLGLFGTLVGLAAGLVLTWNVTAIVNMLQQIFHVQFIPMTAYWSNVLPTQIVAKDIIGVCTMAFGLSLVATLYPALTAFRIQPAEALRYE